MTDNATAMQKAHRQVNQLIRTGKLSRPDHCEKCGGEDRRLKDGRSSIQAHHHKGYDYPLDVEWLCLSCHREITPFPYGNRAAAAKVGWSLVDSIRARYRAGESYYRIADELGFNRTTIHRIVTNRSWPEHAKPAEQEGRHDQA